jgi:hypothetical protein
MHSINYTLSQTKAIPFYFWVVTVMNPRYLHRIGLRRFSMQISFLPWNDERSTILLGYLRSDNISCFVGS